VSAFLKRTVPVAVLLAIVAASPLKVEACATCYGASDSPLAQGMNWGIFTLLGFIGFVLAMVVAFFIHVGRRSARLRATEPSQPQTDQA